MSYSMSSVVVNREVVVFASMVASWKSPFQALVNRIFSHLFKIIVSLLFNSFHTLCKHSHMFGFRLLILRSTFGSLPLFQLAQYQHSYWFAQLKKNPKFLLKY
jgi:hypothetical protein